jgi:UDP-2,4-diacetamido-2,4,6-trideoxy-beta-L-altropyranose hydrolase
VGNGLTTSVTVVADGSADAGLGHISRSSALAVALRCRGVEVRCRAYGAEAPIERDAVAWEPLAHVEPIEADALVLDSYRLSAEGLRGGAPLVLMHDRGEVRDAQLVVSVAGQADGADERSLVGPSYACLRPMFWGMPPRRLGPRVSRVLVTTGGGNAAGWERELALAARAAMPEAAIALVRGPHVGDDKLAPRDDGVEIVDSPDSLLAPLLAADLVISGAGQTMLEAAASGTPCVALAVADNQRAQAELLAELGAIEFVDPPDPERASRAAAELARDADRRSALAQRAQSVVDGFGALRVAYAVAALASRATQGT